MHFQHPELLYALFLLIIPIIIHLFRLRRFQKEDFTNVKFLKKVIQETRKSSRLKKFLILITRLLLLTCLILAFAQPFIPASNKALSPSKTLIYLDNSYSMQASMGENSIFENAINQLLESLNPDKEYALFTNDEEYFKRNTGELKTELQNIGFSQKNLDFKSINLKAENYFKDFPSTQKEFLIISDFQQNLELPKDSLNSEIQFQFIENRLQNFKNMSVDSAYIEDANPENFTLKIILSSNIEITTPVPVSVINGDKLLARNTVSFSGNKTAVIDFRLQNEKIEKGTIEIESSGLKYDDRLFFNNQEKQPIQVVIITAKESNFLERIYTEPEFQTRVFSPSKIDFNKLNAANLIVLNEIDQFSDSFINNLEKVKKEGASLIIIPSSDPSAYKQLLNIFGFPNFNERINSERLITNIQFDHPLLQGVFEDRTQNFDYPKTLISFNLPSSSTILNYQDNNAFLTGKNSVYIFTAPLNSENSNFLNSPLVVPVFYQIGLKAIKKNALYFQTSQTNMIDIPVEMGKDEVLHLKNDALEIIPQQQNFSNRVEITTGDTPLEAGNYKVINNNSTIGSISFNYDRIESELIYSDISSIKNINRYNSVEEYFSKSNAASKMTVLWKWFVIFALIFLAIEMLLLKFFK